jgi:hypothetical protein
MSGGNITLNSAVGGNVTAGRVDTLTLGPQAKINGNLSYSSQQQLTKDSGSIVKGQTTYHQVEKHKQTRQVAMQTFWAVAFYKLIANIIVCMLFIYFFRRGITTVFQRMQKSPWKSGAIGLVSLIITPFIALICLILLWLGMALFLSYGIVILVSVFLADVFIGWFLLRWWEKRSKKIYQLDWKAAIVGPIVLFILVLIPIIGWFISAIIFLVALGALLEEIFVTMQILRGTKKSSRLNQ